MRKKRVGFFPSALLAAVLLTAAAAAAAQEGFPFGQELLLDVDRLPDSKRIPILEISADGHASIDLWCKSGPGQVLVSGAEIKITLGPMQEQYCTPERIARDEVLAVQLSQVTHWRMNDDKVILLGPTTLQFRLSTH